MNFDSNQSQRLRFIRCIAVALILVTHICQEYKIGLAQYTNIGVQMFLVISGFLMGQSETISWKKWALRRFLRLIPSYYIILLLTAIVYWLILDKNIVDFQFVSHFTTLHFLFFPSYPFWGGHLWYITAIALCYAIFPILFYTSRINGIAYLFLYLIVAPLFLTIIFYKTALPYRLCGDIYCFIIGFIGAKFFKQILPKYLTAALIMITMLIVTLHYIFALNNYWDIDFLPNLFSLFGPWERCLCGISFCAIFYLPLFDIITNNALVNFMDKYSYEIYLSHKNFILGPLSLLYISNYTFLNIIIAISSSLLCALVVFRSANIIKSVVENYTELSPNLSLQPTAKSRRG